MRGRSSLEVNDKSFSEDTDIKTSLLPENDSFHQKNDLGRISFTHSSRSETEKGSVHEQLTGELPVGHGCNLTQTIFNGKKFIPGVFQN